MSKRKSIRIYSSIYFHFVKRTNLRWQNVGADFNCSFYHEENAIFPRRWKTNTENIIFDNVCIHERTHKTIKCKLGDSIIDFKSNCCVMKRIFSAIKTKRRFCNGLKEGEKCNHCTNMQCVLLNVLSTLSFCLGESYK